MLHRSNPEFEPKQVGYAFIYGYTLICDILSTIRINFYKCQQIEEILQILPIQLVCLYCIC